MTAKETYTIRGPGEAALRPRLRGGRVGIGIESPSRASARGERDVPTRCLDPADASDQLDRLYRSAWALCGHREDAEDLVQETYLRVLSRPRLLRRADDLPYLLGALRNTFLSGRRRRRADAAPLLEGAAVVESRTTLLPAEAAEAARVVEEIAALPEKLREAVSAVDLLGLSYAEAARAHGVPEGTITSRLYTARRRLAARLD